MNQAALMPSAAQEEEEQALALLHQALAAHAAASPLPAEALAAVAGLGHTLLSQGRYLKAVDAYRFLVIHDPVTLAYRYGLARSLQLAELFEDALMQYQTALVLDGNPSTYGLRLAECQLALGQRPQALATLRMALANHDPATGSASALTRVQQLLSVLEAHHEETRVQTGE
ncbi:hypothetical protein [Paraburkholderia hayleyella]|uniref:hypothetical protein n=1 Tax=Paraburkholderia hayleyella TaxID=2152889 RepID=UPI0012916986|nr:hypothetical protein [Paraburkholderia hayleyella]